MERLCTPAKKSASPLNASVQAKPVISPKSESFFSRRLESDLAGMLAKYPETISHQPFVTILHTLGFVGTKRRRNEDRLVERLWNSLISARGVAKKEELLTRLLGIMGSGPHADALSKRYAVFRANRLNAREQSPSKSTVKAAFMKLCDELTFTPKISPISEKYAESARKRQTTSPVPTDETPVKGTIRSFLNSSRRPSTCSYFPQILTRCGG